MKKEKRNLTFKDIEIRSSNNDGKKIVEGLIPYNSKSVEMWGTTEIIDRTAFNKTLSDKSEVRALFNHDDSRVLGNTKSETLILENTNSGLICKCELPNTTYANDLFEIIERGDVRTMSFGFTPVKWIEDDKGKLRTLKEVQLHEVSFGVTFPAYKETTSLAYMRGLEKNNINVENLNEVLEKDEFNDNDKIIIQNTVNSLNNILGINKEIKQEEIKVEEIKPDNSGLLLQIETELSA